MIKACKDKEKTVVNPIYKFTDREIWQYIRDNNLKINPLYAEGITRVGCIGCPFASRGRREQFARYPKYKLNYIRAFDRMLKARAEKGLTTHSAEWKSGEDVFKWWLGENPKQVTFDDILKEGNE